MTCPPEVPNFPEKACQIFRNSQRDAPRLPRTPWEACAWALAKPFRNLWANWGLYLVVWEVAAISYLFGVVIRGELRSVPIGEAAAQATSTWLFGMAMVVFSSLGAHGFWRDRRDWPKLTVRESETLFLESQRMHERRDQARWQWVSTVTAAHTALLAAWWWLVRNDPSGSNVGLALRAGIFTALALVCLVAAFSLASAGGAAAIASRFLREGAQGQVFDVFTRRAFGQISSVADYFLFMGLTALFLWWSWLAVGYWILSGA